MLSPLGLIGKGLLWKELAIRGALDSSSSSGLLVDLTVEVVVVDVLWIGLSVSSGSSRVKASVG